MHASVPEEEPIAEMNMIPLIDVALTLLIILMVTTAFVHQPGVSLRLPRTVTREGAPETPKDLTVIVSRDGSTYLDGRKVTPPELTARMRATAARDNQSRILIKGDRDALYARIMEVMDSVRQAGLTHIVLPTGLRTSPAGGG